MSSPHIQVKYCLKYLWNRQIFPTHIEIFMSCVVHLVDLKAENIVENSP